MLICLTAGAEDYQQIFKSMAEAVKKEQPHIDYLNSFKRFQPTRGKLIELYKYRNKLKSAQAQEQIKQVCAVGLIKIGDSKTYQSSLKKKLMNSAELEKGLYEGCTTIWCA